MDESNQQELFDGLAQNALGFLERSVKGMESQPQYAIIDFCTAFELVLKARLMQEHWTLVCSKPSTAKLDKFLKGDFHSVTTQQAIERLGNIVKEKLDQDSIDCITSLVEHRNRLVHFWDADFAEPNESTLAQFAGELCKGWYYLERLLCYRWELVFDKHSCEIDRVSKCMRELSGYLDHVYSVKEEGIRKDLSRGVKYLSCPACGYFSVGVAFQHPPLALGECLVCGFTVRLLAVKCPDCHKTTLISDPVTEGCASCRREYGVEYLVGRFGTDTTGMSPRDLRDFGGEQEAYCHSCEYFDQPSVVRWDDSWLCLSCLEVHDHIGPCDYCDTIQTGDLSDSGFSGCMFCEGRLGRLKEE